jgi:hypothetical protein
MHQITCPKCGDDGPVFIVLITEDYVLVQCPDSECMEQQALPVGMDDD